MLKNQNPPYPPFVKGGNSKELLLKSPFDKGGFRGNTVHLIGESSGEITYPVILRE